MNSANLSTSVLLILIVFNVSCGGTKKEESLDSSSSPIAEPTPTPSVPAPFCSDKTSLISYSALGAGTLEDPYLICTASQLNDIGLNQIGWDKHFKLMGDIDLSGVTYNPIGIYTSSPSVDSPFSGFFDGNNLTISNLSLTVADVNSSAGMFMKISRGEVKNLNLSNVNIVGTNQGTGAIAGIITSSTVTNVSVSGSVSGNNYVGGIAGMNLTIASAPSVISDSSSSVNVVATGNSSGGIVGFNNGSNNRALIQRCLSSGSITGFDNVGGLVGYVFGQSTDVARSEIVDSYATGEVSIGGSRGGGLVGSVLWGKVTNSYSKGLVSGAGADKGGIIGCDFVNNYSLFSNNFWNTSPVGQPSSAFGCVASTATGNVGVTETQLTQQSTFAGWNFTTIWQISEGVSSPTLR